MYMNSKTISQSRNFKADEHNGIKRIWNDYIKRAQYTRKWTPTLPAVLFSSGDINSWIIMNIILIYSQRVPLPCIHLIQLVCVNPR